MAHHAHRISLPIVPATMLAALVLSAWIGDAKGQDYGQSYATSEDWRGAYAGVHLGGGIGDANGANTSGAVGGVQGGYNVQSGQAVFGGEADVSASGVEHSGFGPRFRQNWTASARVRAGAAIDRALVYGTGGVALAGTELRDGATKSEKTRTGFVIGAGADFKLTPTIAVRGELLHYNFDKSTYGTTTGPVSLSPTTNVLRGGLNVRF